MYGCHRTRIRHSEHLLIAGLIRHADCICHLHLGNLEVKLLSLTDGHLCDCTVECKALWQHCLAEIFHEQVLWHFDLKGLCKTFFPCDFKGGSACFCDLGCIKVCPDYKMAWTVLIYNTQTYIKSASLLNAVSINHTVFCPLHICVLKGGLNLQRKMITVYLLSIPVILVIRDSFSRCDGMGKAVLLPDHRIKNL